MLASVCGAPQRRTEPLYDCAAHLKPHQHHPPHVLPRACRPPSTICGRQSRALTHFLTNMHIVGGFWISVSWARHHVLCCKPHPYPNTQAINCSVLTVVLVLSHEDCEKMTQNNQIDGFLVRFHDFVCLPFFWLPLTFSLWSLCKINIVFSH